LNSILETQIRYSYEVIVSDASSSDGTEQFLTNLGTDEKEHLSLSIVVDEDRGWPHSVNVGAKKAKGEWILLTNPDIQFNDTIMRLLDYAVQNKEQHPVIGVNLKSPEGTIAKPSRVPNFADIFFCFTALGTVLDRHIAHGGIARAFWQQTLFEKPYYCDHPASSFLCIRSDLFSRTGGFNEKFWLYHADSEFMRRMKHCHIRPVVNPQTVLVHYPSHSMKLRSAEDLRDVFRQGQLAYAQLMGFRRPLCEFLLWMDSAYLRVLQLVNEARKRVRKLL